MKLTSEQVTDIRNAFRLLESKTRHVRDVAYWGAPYGTPLPLPDKPERYSEEWDNLVRQNMAIEAAADSSLTDDTTVASPGYDRTVWRGLRFELPDDIMARLTDATEQPLEPEDILKKHSVGLEILEHMQGFRRVTDDGDVLPDHYKVHGIGLHWTSRRRMAETSAEGGSRPRGLRFIVQAQIRDKDVVPNDDFAIRAGSVFGSGHGDGTENEWSLEPTARVLVTGLTLEQSGMEGRNLLAEPVEITLYQSPLDRSAAEREKIVAKLRRRPSPAQASKMRLRLLELDRRDKVTRQGGPTDEDTAWFALLKERETVRKQLAALPTGKRKLVLKERLDEIDSRLGMAIAEKVAAVIRPVLAMLEEKVIRHVRDVEYWGKPYGTVITPGMKPAGGPRIKYRTSDVYEGTEGIYSSQASTFEIRLPGEHTIAGTTYPNTEPLPGKPVSRDELPPTVYHVSVNAPAVRDSGVLLMMNADDSAGLGGAHSNTVSLTTDPDVAHQLADDMKLYAELAKTRDLDVVLSRLLQEFDDQGLTGFEDLERNAEVNRANPHETFGSVYNNLMSLYFSERATQNKGRNPIILGGVWKEDSPWWDVDPDKVDVIEIPTRDIPRDALIVDFDRGRDFGLEEIRVYADIPITQPKKRRTYAQMRVDLDSKALILDNDKVRIPETASRNATPNPLDPERINAARVPVQPLHSEGGDELGEVLDSPKVTSVAADKVKASINAQLSARIYDHMLADPDLKEWARTHVDKRRAVSAISSIPNGFTSWGNQGEPIAGDDRDTCREQLADIGITGPTAEALMDFRYAEVYESATPEQWRAAQRYANARGLFNGYEIDDEGHRLTYFNFLEKYHDIYDQYSDEELQIRFYTQSTINSWAKSSGDHREESVALQRVAHDLFGVGDTSHLPTFVNDPDSDVEGRTPFYRAFLQATYEQTQQMFDDNGISSVRVYRGMTWDVDSQRGIPSWAADDSIDRDIVDADLRTPTEQYVSQQVATYKDEWVERQTASHAEALLVDAFNDPDKAELIASFSDKRAFAIWYRNYLRTQVIPQDAEWQDLVTYTWENDEEYHYRSQIEREYLGDMLIEFQDHRPETIPAAQQAPLSAWSTSRHTAYAFAEGESPSVSYGLVLGATIPKERILSTTLTGLGCLNEAEVIVLAGDNDEIQVLPYDQS